MMHRIANLFRNVLRRTLVERDLSDEVEAYLDLLTAEKERTGLSRVEARRQARIAMGGADLVKERVRDVRAGAVLGQVGRDLRYGLRSLRRNPGFTALALTTLALGIGGITVVFTLIQAVFLRPLPYPEPERLVMTLEADAEAPSNWRVVAAPNFLDWEERNHVFQRMALYEYLSFNLSGDGEAEAVDGLRATSGLFETLAVPPMLGRGFVPDDDAPGTRVAVLSEGLWRRRYGADSTIIGRTIRINKEPYAVVGVMPRGFAFPSARQALWVPINLNDEDRGRASHSFFAIGRLDDGVSVAEAAAEMGTIGDALRAAYPVDNNNETATAFPMKDLWVLPLRQMLGLLFAAVGLVLLIACVNVASLLLARGSARHRELAIRAAIGGSRRRIAEQLVAESLLLSLLGAGAALVLAIVTLPALVRTLPAGILNVPFRDLGAVALSPGAFIFAVGVAVVAGVAFGLVPAFQSLPDSPADVLKEGEAKGSTGRRGRRFQNALVTVEVALALIVLVAAGLLVTSLARAFELDPGFDPRDVVTFRLPLAQADFYGEPERTEFCADVRRLVATVPGVTAVGAVSHVPLSGANAGRGFVIEGRPAPEPGQNPGANYGVSCPGYFATIGIPILAGRDFSSEDGLSAPRVTIINEALARRYFPDQDPVGQRLKFGRITSRGPWLTIVGVVGDVRHEGVQTNVAPYLYRPYSQSVWPSMAVVVRGKEGMAFPIGAVGTALRGVAPDQPVEDPLAMTFIVERSLGYLRFPMRLLSAFALIAVLLASAGIFGVASQAVVRRTRELGVRAAIGATPAGLYRLVLGQAMRPVLVGLVLGVGGALAATRLLQGLLFGVAPTDLRTYLLVSFLLAVATLIASGVPAFRASRLDPVEALRHE